jgi:hypothetical protein
MLQFLERVLTEFSQINIDGKIVLISGLIFLVTAFFTVVNWIIDIVHEISTNKDEDISKFQYYNR